MAYSGQLSAGAVVGDVVVERLVGVGGMSHVYLGRDRRSGAAVAVKLPRPDASVVRFDIEADISLRLNSPHIVRALRSGMHDGLPYLVMEYVPYPSLNVSIRQRGGRAFDNFSIARVGADVARALDDAYRLSGILAHRDVKPGNIFADFSPGGENRPIKLADFGIVKKVNSDLTGMMQLVGVAEFIAPESVLRNEYGPSSDMYSLGVVLYLMATGRLPFVGGSGIDLAMRHVRERAVPPQQLNPSLASDLASAIERCLAKEPEERYPDMGAAAADFSRIRDRYRGETTVLSGVSWRNGALDRQPPPIAPCAPEPPAPPGPIPFNVPAAHSLWIRQQDAERPVKESGFGAGLVVGSCLLLFLGFILGMLAAVLNRALDPVSRILMGVLATLMILTGLLLLALGIRSMMRSDIASRLSELDLAGLRG